MQRLSPSQPTRRTPSKRASAAAARGILAATLWLLPAGGAMAQTKRCDLVGRDSTVTGNPVQFKRCLDLSALKGQTITVPSNVTRIDNNGLSLCKGSLRLGGDADIMFVLDQSGSMGASYAWINTAVTPNDTLFFFDKGGCADQSTSGTISYRIFEKVGAANPVDTTVSISKLNSATGCSSVSGDPYKVRATAVEQAIDFMAASGSTISTAGFVGFAGTNRNTVKPLTLTAANIATLKSKINIEEQSRTNYFDALDTTKSWLKNPALIKTSKQAIVFISDGSPNTGGDAATLLDGTMPPIYSIFLAGQATPDTAKLKQLSDGSGGKFFRVPPQAPDSVVKIVQQILNLILKEYQPNTALVSNNSLVPVQSASAAMPSGFTLQSDGTSWLMNLTDIIALNANASNQISVKTNFKEINGSSVDTQTITFTIKTTDPASGTSTKLTDNPFEVTCYDRSTLSIQNQQGIRPAFFTDTNTAYKVVVTTAISPLDSVTTPARTTSASDAESPVWKTKTTNPASLVFTGTKAFKVLGATGTKTNGNGTLESNTYDSIIVSWVHPRDPQDVATDVMPVRARGKQAAAYFSRTNGGAPTTQYLVDDTQVFVVITDQAADPRKTYTAVITSENFGIDKETVTLTEGPVGSGIFTGHLNVVPGAKNAGDNNLQVSTNGDQLRVVYKDPVDGDSAVGTAGFDENVQEAADLQFTDASGNVLAPDAIWSPANGKLFITYSDDYAYGRVASKQVSLTLASKKYGNVIGTDHEKITLALDPAASGTRAKWTGSINLADAFPAIDSNGTAETRFRGEAVIVANSHDNAGVQQAATVSDNLVIAYPDSTASIQWKLADTAGVPKGDEGWIVTVKDQDFTTGTNDSVNVTLTCLKSGDSVSNVSAKEVSPGSYVTGTVLKDEAAPNVSDRVLSCLVTDQIRISYVDPVYGTTAELIVNEVAKPEAVADNPGQKFITNDHITLTSATPGAVIYYTLDGTTPVPGTSPVYTAPLQLTLTTTLKAVAVKPGFKDSKLLTQTYTKTFTASHLEILDENGNQIVNRTLTGVSKAVRIRLATTQDNLPGTKVDARTVAARDSESLFLNNLNFLGNAFEYTEQVAFKSPSPRSNGNDTLEASGTDTLIARWVNPFDSTDVAADTVFVKPAFVAAQVYFSATEGGARITQYPVNQDSIFIVVVTRPRDPALTYTVLVTTSELGADKETLTLKELSPGVFSAKAPVGTTGKIPGDNIIQVAAAGDQLTAVFVDPVYLDSYRGDAGFARQVQESATLDFIDSAGNVVAPADIWSPAEGKVYLRYSDDWNPGIDSLVHVKTARLVLVNKKSGEIVGTDSETVALTLKPGPTGTRGVWEGSLSLIDRATAKAGDDTLETYYRGELTASVTPHDNAGAPGSPDIQDQLIIAYPNEPAVIVITDTSGGAVTRATGKVEIAIHDQLFTKSGDATINATVSCAQSGDKVSNVVLVWDGAQYVVKPPLDKGEINTGAVDKSDALLLCRDSDILTVTYVDPVFLDPRSGDVTWTDDTKGRMYYASSKDNSEITSVADAVDKDFVVVVEGKSPTRDKIDTIAVTLTTAQGEKETVPAVETGVFTGKFIVKVDFLFRSSDPTKDDGKIEGRISVANRVNQVLMNGSADIGGETVKGDLSLFSSYNLAVKAYIKDEDGDGRADHAYFVFDRKLSRLPAKLDSVYWNRVGSSYSRAAGSAMLSFLGSDSSIVAADFSKSQFGANLTDIPDGQNPYGLFPDDNLFGGQKALLSDSVGPVPVAAVKLPSNLQSYDVTSTEKRFNPDTLMITVSEKIKTTSTGFAGMLRFSKGCADYSQSVPVRTYSEPSVSPDGLTWTVIVDNTADAQVPLVDDCIFLETDGRYVDLPGNLPARLGVPLTGANPKLVIRSFRGFPPVVGLDPGSPGFVLVTNDIRTDAGGTFSSTDNHGNWQVSWIPPYGFNQDDPIGSLTQVANHFDDAGSQDRHPEVATPEPMPRNISAVQVITTSSYKAQISIFDNLGHFVRSMEQVYGLNGEDKNPWRATDKGQLSFLVWDLKDMNGQLAGQGVYVWKVSFVFGDKNSKSEVMYTRTGVMRSKGLEGR